MEAKLHALPALLEKQGVLVDITRHVVIPFFAGYCFNPYCRRVLEEEEVARLDKEKAVGIQRQCLRCLYQCAYNNNNLGEDEAEGQHCNWYGLRSTFDEEGMCPNHSDVRLGELYCYLCREIVYDGEDAEEWYEAQAEHALRDMRCLPCWRESQPQIEYNTRKRPRVY
jgi:hypothetical protein